jgi:hypothetical protein
MENASLWEWFPIFQILNNQNIDSDELSLTVDDLFLNSAWKMNNFPKDTCKTGITMISFCAASWVASGKYFCINSLMPVYSYKEAELIVFIFT